MSMYLYTNEGIFKYETPKEISEHICRSSTLPMDEIFISTETKYPYLSILVNGDHACIHYFESEDGAMFQSLGNGKEGIVFLAAGEEWKAPADTIVTLETAIKCMKEFFETMKRPKCIKWQEL